MNKVKLLLSGLLLIMFVHDIFSDEFRVISFQKDESDLAALRYSKKDINDDNCALLKIQTDLTGLSFESNLWISGDVVKKPGEYWIYLSPREKRIRIMKEGFIPLNYTFDILIESSAVYVMVLTSDDQEQLTPRTGFVLITTRPDDAEVWINGEYKGQSTYQHEMQQGVYQIRILKEMCVTYEGDFTVFPDSTTEVPITLQANYGSITINSVPEQGAEIVLDGKSLNAQTPFTVDQLSPGTHNLILRKDFYEPARYEFSVYTGEAKTLNINMQPVFAIITILARGSQIFIDGQYMGIGRFSGRLVSGFHSLEVKRENFYTETSRIEVEAGVDQTIRIELKPIVGSLSVMSDPPKAEIILNGVTHGYTPRILRGLQVGEYELTLLLSNHERITKNITITEGAKLTINETLIPVAGAITDEEESEEPITYVIEDVPVVADETEGQNLQQDEEGKVVPEDQNLQQQTEEEKDIKTEEIADDDVQKPVDDPIKTEEIEKEPEKHPIVKPEDKPEDKPIQDNTKPDKRLFIRPIGAYAMDPFNDRPAGMAYSVTETSDLVYTFKTEKVSLSKGIHAGLAMGTYITSWIGAELQFTYLINQETTVKDSYLYTDGNYSNTYTIQSKFMRFALSMILYKNFNTVSLYLAPGLLVGSPKITYSHLYYDQYNGFYDEEFQKWDYKGGTAIGFTGALGINIMPSDIFGFFIEIRTDIINYAPTNGYRQDYYFVQDGQHMDPDNSTYATEIEFVDSYTEPYDPNPAVPQQQLRLTYPLSSIQAAFGVIIKLF